MKTGIHSKPHYAWLIFVSCCMIQGGVVGLIQNSCGIFYQPICRELGFSLSSIALYTSLRGLAGCLILPFSTFLIQKAPLRILLSSAVACFALSNFLMGTFSKLWQWYLAAIIQGLASSFLVFVTTPILLGNWFQKYLGFSIGLSSAFSGIFGMTANPFGNWLIESLGWRAAYFILSVLCAVLVLPFTLLVIRKTPEEMGTTPFGKENGRNAFPNLSAGVKEQEPSIRLSPALCLAVVLFLELASMTTMGFTQILPSFGTSQGLSPSAAAFLVSLSMLGNTVGKFSMGAESDRFGILRVAVIAFLLPFSGFLLMSSGEPLVYGAAFLSGMSMPAAMVVMPILIRNLYGAFRYEKVYSFTTLVGNIAWAFSGPLFGYFYETTGNYRSSILFCAGILFAAVGILVLLARRLRLQKRN